MVDLDLIRARKQVYGNSFPSMARDMSEYFSEKFNKEVIITSAEASLIMKFMKKARMKSLGETIAADPGGVGLSRAMKDTIDDFENYKWISENYKEYEML